ncbi:MAG: InlB B-repeat-containing protein [Bacillota bacterium]|nr:InlB B-repeat-containing protein [Bacillota bacterium]
MNKRKLLSILLSIFVILAFMPQLAFAADTATKIPYLDASGTQKTCEGATVVTSEDTTWGDDGNEGWYVVKSDVNINGSVTVNDKVNVHLILADGYTLTVTGDITGSNLNIYRTAGGTGAVHVNGSIKGGYGSHMPILGTGGNITISGGFVKASKINGGSGYHGNGGSVIINGGVVEASEINGGSAFYGNGGNVTINDGVVEASEINGGSASYGNGGKVTINGGIVIQGNSGRVYGTSVTLNESFTISEGKTLTIERGTTLTIPENVILTNNGTIINNGTINGTVNGNQPIDFSMRYLDETGTEKTASNVTVIAADNIYRFNTLSHGWYVVDGTVTANKRITISGTVDLILADGCNFTVNGGIEVESLNCLRVYAQSTGDNMGKLTANTKDGDNAGIGGSVGNTGGFITIIGGTVTAESTNGAGIGGGAGEYHDGVYNGGDGCGVSIIGGNVKASSQYGAGIGGGSGSKGNGGNGGDVIISGGTVTAESTNGAGIGGGGVEESDGVNNGGNGGRVTISGGTVKASSQYGAGIGGGSGSKGNGGNGGQVTISGGTVTATSRNGKGIGGGSGDEGNQVGGSGTFQTDNGNAVVFASSIADKRTINWNGVIFEKNEGKVYGSSVTPTDDFTIDGGKTLHIPEGSALTISGITAVNNGSVYVDGTVSGLGGDLYYPLTVDGGTADKTYTYDSKSYGKAGECIALTGTNIPVGQKATWISTPSVEISDGSFIMPNNGLSITTQFSPITYTVTFDTDGGTEIDSKTGVKWTDVVLDGISDPTKEGWKFLGWKYRDTVVSAQTTYGVLASSDSVSSIELKAQWKDVTLPVILGIIPGNTYCDAVEFEASDNDGIASVKAGDDVLKAGTNGKYTLEKGKGKVTVVAADKTGNTVRATVTVNNGHTGGEATCASKATCEYCGEEYGELDSSNHNLENIPAKDATVTETGNKEYWHCKDCGNNFSDATGMNSISDLDGWKTGEGRIDKIPIKITEGKGQSITAGEKKELTFGSNAAYRDFIRVELDGKALDEKNYSVNEKSMVVTLNADFVATLSAGEHAISIVSESGIAETTFTVAKKASSGTTDDSDNESKTGDDANLALWLALMLLSGAGITGVTAYNRRKRTNE